MIRLMLVMVALVFLIIGLTKHSWVDALLFGLAVAVGLTPEMLPMIVMLTMMSFSPASLAAIRRVNATRALSARRLVPSALYSRPFVAKNQMNNDAPMRLLPSTNE